MECRTCKCCMFYVPRPGGLVGRCRRHAPIIPERNVFVVWDTPPVGVGCSPAMQGWPVMYPDSWCGDYKLSGELA